MRVRLLGEDLIAYRASDGHVGLVDAYCPHRRAPMFFGRNEECGLRCVYHGWKFDASGACVDMPSEPPDSLFKNKVTITAYPVRERGGVLWTYMGAPESMGEVPGFEWLGLPDTRRYISTWEQDCNYLQCLEGEIDSAHVSFLHRPQLVPGATTIGDAELASDRAPRWKVDPKPHGLVAAAARKTADGRAFWRINHFLMPFYSMVAPRPGGACTFRWWIPRDDEHTFAITVTYVTDRDLTEHEISQWQRGDARHPVLIPGTKRQVANAGNDFTIDRALQKAGLFSGIRGIRAQDTAMTEGMGAIVDRSREHLGTSDTAIIAMRRVLLQAVRGLALGEVPVAAQGGEIYAVRPATGYLPADLDYDRDPAMTHEIYAAASGRGTV